MNKALAAALFAAVFFAAGCAGSNRAAREANPAPCPNVVVLTEAARFIDFEGEQRVEDVAYSGEITNVEIACRYFEDRPIEAELDLALAFGKGPKGADNTKVFNYFVAVARKDLEVIAKQEFQVPVEFSEKRSIVAVNEEIDKIVIPRADENVSGVNFEIIVGFALTPQQAIFNRSGKSLKFPEIQ